MSKSEIRMNDECQNPNDEPSVFGLRISFVILISTFVIPLPSPALTFCGPLEVARTQRAQLRFDRSSDRSGGSDHPAAPRDRK